MGVLDLTGVGPVATLFQDVIDKIFPDKESMAKDREAFMLQAQQLDNQLNQGQIAINQQEAASTSIFVAGWRPFIGWVCGTAFAYHLILQPLCTYVMAARGVTFPLPQFDVTTLTTVLLTMLGMGSLRTVEKMGDSNNLPWQKK